MQGNPEHDELIPHSSIGVIPGPNSPQRSGLVKLRLPRVSTLEKYPTR